MFREFEKDTEKKTPEVLFRKVVSLGSEKV